MANKMINRSLQLSLTIITLLTLANIKFAAHADETPAPIFEDIVIGREFDSYPLIVNGMSGGNIAANQLAERTETPTGPCKGFFDREPDHTLQLTSKFDYLKLQVQSPKDTTLIIEGPGGSWCNDDLEGKNPGITGEWLPGEYKVWIGSYDQNDYLPYQLKITEAE